MFWLQAIARVNRPYEDEEERKKPCGFVLDFVGIFDNLEKALSFDSSDIEGVIRDLEELKRKFAEDMEKARQDYLSLIKGLSGDKAVDRILEYFMDEGKETGLLSFFRELQDIYEVLSPDAFLRDYLSDFETLVRIYRILREAYETKLLLTEILQGKLQSLSQNILRQAL